MHFINCYITRYKRTFKFKKAFLFLLLSSSIYSCGIFFPRDYKITVYNQTEATVDGYINGLYLGHITSDGGGGGLHVKANDRACIILPEQHQGFRFIVPSDRPSTAGVTLTVQIDGNGNPVLKPFVENVFTLQDTTSCP